MFTPHACLCEWTIRWTPQVQAALGVSGGFHETEGYLLLGEAFLAVVLVIFMAFGRWIVAAALLALCLGLPFALFLSLFGLGIGRDVLEHAQFELGFLCASVLGPAILVGGLLRLLWFGFRALLLRAPADIRV